MGHDRINLQIDRNCIDIYIFAAETNIIKVERRCKKRVDRGGCVCILLSRIPCRHVLSSSGVKLNCLRCEYIFAKC